MLLTIAKILIAFLSVCGVYLIAGAFYLASQGANANPVQPDDINTAQDATEAVLQVTWERPTKYVDGKDLPIEDINGYNLYHTVDGGKVAYTGWISEKGGTTQYNYTPTTSGRYCFHMETVTHSAGKSAKSEPPACIDYVEAVPEPETPVDPESPPTPVTPPIINSPCGPNTVEVKQLSWLFNDTKKRWMM